LLTCPEIECCHAVWQQQQQQRLRRVEWLGQEWIQAAVEGAVEGVKVAERLVKMAAAAAAATVGADPAAAAAAAERCCRQVQVQQTA
jgi:hypothetical protein